MNIAPHLVIICESIKKKKTHSNIQGDDSSVLEEKKERLLRSTTSEAISLQGMNKH